MPAKGTQMKSVSVKKRPAVMACMLAVAGMLAGANASAEQKTLYLGMNGGDMQRGFEEHVFPAFEKANNVKIVVVPGTSTDVLAKAQAFKDKPQMHIMFLDDGIMNRATKMGLCEPIKDDKALSELYPETLIGKNMAAGVVTTMTGLAYNTKLFKENNWAPPTSWKDLADPKYKGKVVFQSVASSTYGLHAFMMLNRIDGGDDSNYQDALTKFKDTVAKNVVAYVPSSAKISEMTQTGEAALFPLTPTAIYSLKEKKLPVEYVDPKEGSVLLAVAQCVIANNSEPELAQKLASYLLSVSAQEGALKFGQYPSNKNVAAKTEHKELLGDFEKYMKHVVVMDWDAINKVRPKLNRDWKEQIER